MNELKPCPFCGRERPSIGIRCVIGERAWRVHCICGAVGGPWPRREDEDFGTQDEAIAAWNTRKHAQEDAAQEGAIPVRVYYSVEHDNFYCNDTLKGMGTPFYMKWHARRREFPTLRSEGETE